MTVLAIVTNIDASKSSFLYWNLYKAFLIDSDGEFKKGFQFNTFHLASLQENLGYVQNLHDFKNSTSQVHFIEPFTYGFKGCCWKTTSIESDSLTTSANQQAGVSLEFEMIAKVFDVNNVAPRIVLPSMWYVNIGCNSSLELRPFDQDNDDVIQCRWADQNEAGFAAFNASEHPFITLVSETCMLEFNAEKFQKFYEASGWSNPDLLSIPIAIMIEDFLDNFKRSSMPVQFLVATMPSSDTGGDSVLDDQTDASMDNRGDAEAFQTIEPTEMDDCDLIPVLSSIKDLVSLTDQESYEEIKRSFDVYEGGRNGNHINHCTFFM